MEVNNTVALQVDELKGQVKSRWQDLLSQKNLEGLVKDVWKPQAQVLSDGRHRVAVVTLKNQGNEHKVAVKAFGRQNWLKDRVDQHRGSKAGRSFQAAYVLTQHGVGTPEPIAYLDRWQNGRLVESYYLSHFVPGLRSFRDVLLDYYEEGRDSSEFVSLLEVIGQAIRGMHDAGFCHRDLGNQNIELTGEEAVIDGEVHFIDLNRGLLRDELSISQRARDFARIYLPSAFLDILLSYYWSGEVPREFTKALRSSQRRFRWWQRSYRWRHPIKSRRPDRSGVRPNPPYQDIWIWDQRSSQPAVTLNRRDRAKFYPRGRHWQVVQSTLRALPGVWRTYQELLPKAFACSVSLKGRIGMSLEMTDLSIEKQRSFLSELGKIPLVVRLCHHEGQVQWRKSIACIHELHRQGHDVFVAILQDRRAVLEPQSWEAFVTEIVEELAPVAKGFEVCHAINRTKWGVHSSDQYRNLLQPLLALQQRFPNLIITGPACIDFEFHYVVTALAHLPQGLKLGALSHHLYVDRRGAPENVQGPFSTLEKSALLRAIAKHSSVCTDRVIVSEVNWPLAGSGLWSPVTCTSWPPHLPESPVHVSEVDYGYYMLRYLVLTLCSGFVDQVYWWRLVSHGFGLIDERGAGGWRKRPAFHMLATFLKILGEATFTEKLDLPQGVYGMRFERQTDEVVMLWCHQTTFQGPWPFDAEVRDVFGELTDPNEVGEAPFYFFSKRSELKTSHSNQG